MSSDESFSDGKYLTAKAKNVLIFSIISLFFLFFIGIFDQIEEPGNFFEKKEYTGKFYTLVFPDKNVVKNYRIPAEVSRQYDCDGESCTSIYYVEKIIFPNGGSPTFSDCTPSLKSKTLCIADNDDQTEFYIKLTNERVDE